MKLSIIIPTYNTNEYLIKLLQKLQEQIIDGIEVIVVDDHSDNPLKLDFPNWSKFIQLEKNSGGAGKPRNIGLDIAIGEYITFIDSDDMVADNYIEKVMQAIKLNKDIIYLSWEYPGHKQIMTIKPPTWNCSVWCRVYKRSLIGDTRFREDLKIAEDWDFNNKLNPKSSCCIKDIIYYYNSGREGSLTNG